VPSSRNLVRWLAALSLLYIAALGGTSYWMDWQAMQAIEQQELERVRLRARTLASLVEREFDKSRTVLLSVEERFRFKEAWRDRDWKEMKRHLADVLALEPGFLFASVYEPDGTLRAIEPPDPIVGRNYAHRDWYKGATARKGPYVSEVYKTDAAPNPLVVAVAVPIRDDRGEITGILMAPYTAAGLEKSLRALEDTPGGALYIADQNGVLVASTAEQLAGQKLTLAGPIARLRSGEEGSTRTDWGSGEMFAGYAAARDLGWMVLSARSADDAMALARQLRAWGVAAGAFLSLIYLVTMGIALKLVREQAALFHANQRLTESLRAAKEDLEWRVRERTTELERANQSLRESHERYRSVVETATDAILNIDDHSLITFANPAVARIFGYTPQELVGQKLTMLMPEYLRHLHETGIRRYQETGKRHINWEGIELPGLHRLGHEIPLEVSFGECGKDGRPLFTGFVRDISERKRAQQALRDSEQQYRLLFESHPHPMWIFDQETLAFLAVNDAAVSHYGFLREEFLAMTIKDIRPVEEIPSLLADIDAGHLGYDAAGIWKHVKKNGAVIEVEISSHDVSWAGRPGKLVLAMDVTERRQLQKQLVQAQKMEAVGHLAGGVAHDFNNLLGVIIGYCEILATTGQLQEKDRERVAEIKKAGDRAATLTRQLLAFSRQQVIEPRVLDLNALLADMSKMLRRLIGEDIELVTRLSSGLGRVKADPGQLEQVVMNLAVNARDAMPRGGKLILETGNVSLDENYARTHVTVQPGKFVLLAITDTGVGMDEETQARIFEPFFTTKGEGKGTGLGLATVYGIVKQSGGNIWVYSEPGRGTTFKIYLPLVADPAEPAQAEEIAFLPRGKETILVVEDADAMRKLTCEFLAGMGYTVLEAHDGVDALEKAAQHSTPIDLLLTDVVMPRMSGRELAAQMTERDPGLKVLYMSGYTDDAVVRHGVLDASMAFIQKPFALHALAARVREVLDNSPGKAP
jgi:hypothetical protein